MRIDVPYGQGSIPLEVPDSAEIVFAKCRDGDAGVVVAAAAASVAARATFDPALTVRRA